MNNKIEALYTLYKALTEEVATLRHNQKVIYEEIIDNKEKIKSIQNSLNKIENVFLGTGTATVDLKTDKKILWDSRESNVPENLFKKE